MAAQALYLKYRPRTFDEVVGQEAITHTLRNALRQGRIRHAYLFTGSRGTGKTTTARLLAKAVNCLAPEDERPCNACTICTAINDGRLLDLIEIDAASNRGIDEIRDIREKAGFRPNEARYKVYVLDEAHMLTEPAFNALLKTLEEPPPHVIFALVTTDPHKIPATITSRCQRFDFRRIPVQAITERLEEIARQEGLTAEPAALDLIARHSTGALRDAISLLDQLMGYGDQITLDQVQMVLGATGGEAAGQLVGLLARGDVAGGLTLIDRVVGDGVDTRQFGREVVEYLRGLLLIKEGAGTHLLDATAEQAAEMEGVAVQLSTGQLLEALRLFNGAVTDLKGGLQTILHLPLEMALIESVLHAATPPARPATPERNVAAVDSAPLRSQSRTSGRAVAEPAPGEASPDRKESGSAGGVDGAPAERMVAPVSAPAEQSPGAVLYQTGPEPGAERSDSRKISGVGGGGLALDQVQRRWPEIIDAVQALNRTTAAVLRSDCHPVELIDDQIVVTVPSSILRDKLENPQRKVEVQEAVSSVLGVQSRIRLVLAAEYALRPSLQPPPQAATPDLSDQTAATEDDQVPDEISRWAAERGGQATIVK
ncbi:MAG: DNA polymerase III subunit gamma/tau [Anaerolineae bacterium]|nr:DNA polymerase III subunit gamma/tau [Anaerolineae bacterium]